MLREQEGEAADSRPFKSFKDYEPGFVHIDIKHLPQMADESSRRYLFVAIDRATQWVTLKIREDKSARSARTFLNKLIQAAPFKVQKVLTDCDKAFTDRFSASGEHPSARSGLPGAHHRAPDHQAQTATDQRYGRALQWAHCRDSPSHPVRFIKGSAPDAAQLPGGLQSPHPSESARSHHTDSGTQAVAGKAPRDLCEKGVITIRDLTIFALPLILFSTLDKLKRKNSYSQGT